MIGLRVDWPGQEILMVNRCDRESITGLGTQHNELTYLAILYFLEEGVGRCPGLTVHGQSTGCRYLTVVGLFNHHDLSSMYSREACWPCPSVMCTRQLRKDGLC